MDMNYRGIINMLVMCGCVGQSGGGWSHYVGQEKLRPQTGWTPLAFALDWNRPPRHMNSTSFFYAHTDQWRYETLGVDEILSPTAPEGRLGRQPDRLQHPRRAHGLAALGTRSSRPIRSRCPRRPPPPARRPRTTSPGAEGRSLSMSCEDPDDPANWPRNMFVWRSNLLGSSGKGHEYFLKHLLGTTHGVLGKDLGEEGRRKHRRRPSGTTRRRKESSTCW
jgi:nitrate reductase alpha subunit